MLLIDDHASHIITQMIDYCINQKIILLYLSTHTTHLLQSLNVEVFASLATAYKTHVQRVTQLEISYSINKTVEKCDDRLVSSSSRVTTQSR